MQISFRLLKFSLVLMSSFSVVHCSKSAKPSTPSKETAQEAPQDPETSPEAPKIPVPKTLAETLAEMTITPKNLKFNNVDVVDLDINTPQVSPYGEFQIGRTLNYFLFNDIEFVIYGEDGVFAAECQYSNVDPTFGPGHRNCEIAHAESYDTLILCTPSTAGASVAHAQEWPGDTLAMEPGRGMTCWKDGQPLKSKKIFTY